MKKNNNKFLYNFIIFFIIIFIWMYNNIHIENIDFDILTRIMKPNFPKGGINYDPQYHYFYIISYFLNILNIEYNSIYYPKILWVFEKFLTLLAFYKINNIVFKDKNIFIIFCFLYLTLTKSGEVDQKTIALPIQLFSLYFLLNKKFIISGILCGFLFYFHIGVAVWWFLPSAITLCLIFLFNLNQKNFYNCLAFNFLAIIIATPILIFYLNADTSFSNNLIFKEYWYGINNSLYSLFTNNNYISLFYLFCPSFIFFIFIFLFNNKRKYYQNFNKEIINLLFVIVIAIFIILIVNTILVDLFYLGSFMKLQLIRSVNLIFLFSLFFISYAIINQIKKNNYLFFIILLIILMPNPFWIIYSYINFYLILYSYLIFLSLFELLNCYNFQYLNFLNTIFNKLFNRFFEFINLSKNLFLFIITFSFISVTINIFDLDKKIIFKVLKKNFVIDQSITILESLNVDIKNYLDNHLDERNIIIMQPFQYGDYSYLTKFKTFINVNTMYGYIPIQYNDYIDIVHKQFGYKVSQVKNGSALNELWANLDTNQILSLKEKYKITHMIREIDLPLNFEIIYSNKHFHVYEIK